MLAMIALVGGIIVAVVVIGVGVMLVLLTQQKGRQAGDDMALTLAQVLNRDDRQGQMNNMVERSRELVYSSRQAYDDCVSQEFHNMEPLMRDLLDESRTGAQQVEKTRESLSQVILTDLSLAQREYAERMKKANSLNVSLMKTSVPSIKQLEVGSIDKVNSNVKAPPGFVELRKMDEKSGYCDAQSGFYIGNINAKLPGSDADLNFKLSSLAAPVGSTISAARLTDASVFKSGVIVPVLTGDKAVDEAQKQEAKKKAQNIDQIPSAIRVKIGVDIAAGDQGQLKNQVGVTTSATTAGAQPAPDQP